MIRTLVAIALLVGCKDKAPPRWRGIPTGKPVACSWQPSATLATCVSESRVYTCVKTRGGDDAGAFDEITCAPQTAPLPAEAP